MTWCCDVIMRRSSSPDSKSEKSSVTQMTSMSAGALGGPGGGRMGRSRRRNKHAPEAFVSVQLEKVPQRDLMLNEFVKKQSTMGQMMRNPDKVAEMKR